VRFILVFVLSVILLLAGYRLLIGTPLNDWYLFQVARHTTVVLRLVGDAAELERGPVSTPPAEVRASLDAWRTGRHAPTPEETAAAPQDPLSPYERYLFRLHSARRNGAQVAEGPRVYFVWKEGLDEKLREKRAALEKLAAQDEARERAANELKALQEQQKALRQDPVERNELRGQSFSFRVVPECGAIEVMSIFTAAIIAFPTRWRRRLVGLAIGLPLLYLVNIGRLACLGVIGAYTTNDAWFDFAHEYVWQAIYIVFVVALWLAWVELLVRKRA
jgi:exosortase/archaeosortase family protein